MRVSTDGRSRSGSGVGRWSGTTVGNNYELLEELARGGMGAVYRAWDRGAGRDVAIKLLLAADGGRVDELRRRRVLREAETLARLRHPHVVAVHGAGEHQGVPYLVLELVQGESLEQRLVREGRLPLREAALIGAKLARALAHVHAQEVLHRDLKPGNVLLRALDREPLLTDFGLALDLSHEGTRLSQTGTFLGTPQYWPPEQARGELQRIGPWSDVYGLGATLYQLITGRPPHEGGSLHELVQAAEGAKTPLRTLRPEIAPELARAVERCLAPDPAARPGALELAEELERAARRPEVHGGAGRGPLVVGVGAAGALALLGLALGVALLADPGGAARERGSGAASALPSATPGGPTRPLAPQPGVGAGADAQPGFGADADDPFAVPSGWEALSLDPALLTDGARHPALEVSAPWGVTPREVALRLAATGEDRPELRLPVELGAGPWRLRIQLAVACAEPGTCFSAGLQLSPEARVEAPVPVLVLAGGDAREELLMFSAGLHDDLRVQAHPTEAPTARPTLLLELEYGGREDPWLLFACTSSSGRVEARLEPRAALPAAEWHLRVGLNLYATPTTPLALAIVDLVRCQLVAPRGAVRPARPAPGWERVVGRLGRTYLRGDLQEIARTAGDVGVKAAAESDASLFPPASFLGALARARLGPRDEAITLFSSFRKAGALERDMFERSSWFESIAYRALPRLGPAERRALAQAYVTEVVPTLDRAGLLQESEQRLAEARAIRRANPGRARIALAEAALMLVWLAEVDRTDAALLADAWLQLGDPESALALADGDRDPDLRLCAGLAAYRLGRWPEAVSLLEQVPLQAADPANQGALLRTIERAKQRLR